MKNRLVFNTLAEAKAAEDAIRQFGSKLFQQEGIPIDSEGRVVDGQGKVLIDRFSIIQELEDETWAIADPGTEDWMGSRVNRGRLTRIIATALNSQIGQSARDKVQDQYTVAEARTLTFKNADT